MDSPLFASVVVAAAVVAAVVVDAPDVAAVVVVAPVAQLQKTALRDPPVPLAA
jgi:hypothetical protein